MRFVATAHSIPTAEYEKFQYRVRNRVENFIGPDPDFLITPLKSKLAMMLTWSVAPDALMVGHWHIRCSHLGLFFELRDGEVMEGGYTVLGHRRTEALYRGWAEPICALARTSWRIEQHGYVAASAAEWAEEQPWR